MAWPRAARRRGRRWSCSSATTVARVLELDRQAARRGLGEHEEQRLEWRLLEAQAAQRDALADERGDVGVDALLRPVGGQPALGCGGDREVAVASGQGERRGIVRGVDAVALRRRLLAQ